MSDYEVNGPTINGPVRVLLNERVVIGDKWFLLTSGEASPDKAYRDRDWLIDAYHSQNKTLQEIADETGVTPMTINQWLVKHSIPSRPRGRRTE
ncbi:MAG: hypothetical protein HOC79_00920 [Euryarchaeota archaeon]|nr:hypothetical protein [Euryarchaeota archaeon]